MKDEELFKAWKSEQYKDQSTEEKLEFVEHLHTFPKYFEKTFIDGYHEGLKDCAKSRLNVTTISDCPIKDDWHYVKDEGTPIHEGHYLVCLRNKNHDILDCWILFDKDVGWYSLQVRLVDIYAWKEIVLPELPKESE